MKEEPPAFYAGECQNGKKNKEKVYGHDQVGSSRFRRRGCRQH
jgi:hypothetical protein